MELQESAVISAFLNGYRYGKLKIEIKKGSSMLPFSLLSTSQVQYRPDYNNTKLFFRCCFRFSYCVSN
jgi:hypothetical protein